MKLENNFTIDAPVAKAWEALNSPETVAPCFPGATLTDYEGDAFTGTVKVKLGPIAMTYKGKGTYVSRDEAAHEVVIDARGRDSRGNGTANATVTASLAADGPDRTAVSMVTDMTITGKPAQFGRGVISDVADKIIGQFSACVARKLAPGAGEPVSAPASDARADAARRAASMNGAASSASAASSAGAGASAADAPASTAMTPEPARAASSAAAGTSEADAPASTAITPEPARPAPSAAAGTSEAAAPSSTAMPSGHVRPSPTPRATPVRAPTTPRAPVHSEVEAIDLFDTAGAPVLKRLAPVAGGALLLLLVVWLVRRLRA